jgi:SNF2 family DNA or RNA helicase
MDRIDELRAEIRRLEAERDRPVTADQQAKVCKLEDLPPVPRAVTEPWAHQRRAFWFLHHKLGLDTAQPSGGALLAMDMGTGKTKVTIDFLNNYPTGGGHHLVFCPLSVVPTWPAEIKTHGAGKYRVVALDKGPVAKRTEWAKEALEGAAASGQVAVIVINHESAWRNPFRDFVLERQWGCIVVDESHRAKAPGGKFAKFCGVAARRAETRLALTGTPMPRDHMDLYAQGRFIDSNVFGSSFTTYKSRYGIWQDIKTNKVDRRGNRITARKLIGIRHKEELMRKLDEMSYRVQADDVLDLPPAVVIRRTCSLTPAERKAYESIREHLIAEVDGGFVTASNVLSKILRLQQVAQGVVQDEEGQVHTIGESKRKLLEECLLDLDSDTPAVVFCRFHTDLDAVHITCENIGRGCLELSGRLNQLEEFKEGGGPILAVQIQSGGVGVDLSRAAYSFYYTPTYDGGAYEQSLRRTRRPTKHQHGSYFYYHLVAENTIDLDVYRALVNKKKVADSVLEGIKGQ